MVQALDSQRRPVYTTTEQASDQQVGCCGPARRAGKRQAGLECDVCGLPFARLQGRVLLIQSIHHGKVHWNAVSIDALMEMVEGI